MKTSKKIAASIITLIACASLMDNWFLFNDNYRLRNNVRDLSQWKEKYITEAEAHNNCEIDLDNTEQKLAQTQQELEQVKKN